MQICYELPPPWGYYCIQIPTTPPGGNPSFAPASTIIPASYGGLIPTGQAAFYPCLNLASGLNEYRTFDVTQPQNDPVNPSSYAWRVEQIKSYRNPTIRKLLWTYTDLGQVSVSWMLTGTNENGQVVSQTTSLGVGNLVPTYAMMTTEVDINLTAMNLQLSVSKQAGEGPLSVVKIVMVGEVEEVTL